MGKKASDFLARLTRRILPITIASVGLWLRRFRQVWHGQEAHDRLPFPERSLLPALRDPPPPEEF